MKTIILILLFVQLGFAQCNLLLFDSGYKNPETTQYVSGLTTPVLPAQALLIDAFVTMVKDSFAVSSLSSLADVIYLTANQTQELALRNLVKRSHDGTVNGTVTFTEYQGILGDGATGYINANYVPSTDGITFTLNDASFGVYVRTIRAASSSKYAIGCARGDGSGYSIIALERSANLSRQYINSTGLSGGTVTNTSGLSILVRTGSTTTQFYKNGVGVAPDTDASTVLPDVPFVVLAANTGGSMGQFDDIEVSFVIIGKGFDSVGGRKWKNCVEWYMDQLGKGVL